ncbi:hypothetical protein AD944_03785 [Acetobacter tropicalis]|nr:hypothetical protein AD944_03785 [Acetobacter tropicalis]
MCNDVGIGFECAFMSILTPQGDAYRAGFLNKISFPARALAKARRVLYIRRIEPFGFKSPQSGALSLLTQKCAG